MPVLGRLVGSSFQNVITDVDHWIAFGLLLAIGGKMIYEALTPAESTAHDGVGGDYRDHGLVFQQLDGTPWRPDWISRQFKRLMKISGAAVGLLAMPSLKSMRLTAVTNLHGEGVALEVIANVTGHVDETVTREHYLAVTAENTRQGFEILAERLRPRRSDRHSDRRPRSSRSEGGAATMN